LSFQPELKGLNIEYFSPLFGEGWVVLGGAEKIFLDDAKPKSIEGKIANARFFMRKGRGHVWTSFCEDALAIFVDQKKLLAAIFDGVSGEMDGSGGIASRIAAKSIIEYAKRINEQNCETLLSEYKDECVKKIKKGGTTALILVIFEGKRCQLYNKGDSLCYSNHELVNAPDSIGNVLLKWLNEESGFSRYDFEKKQKLTLYSDGVFNALDDFTMVEID
jgi:serine/threonine protein phosphatase PrpC